MSDDDNVEWEVEKKRYLVLSFWGFILAVIFYLIPNDARKIEIESLVPIDNLILNKNPEIEHSKNGDIIKLYSKKYNQPFLIGGFDLDFTSKGYILYDLKEGDTINVKIDADETDNLNKKEIDIHSLIKDSKEYISLTERNYKANKDLKLLIPIGIYFIFIGLLIQCFKSKPSISPTVIICFGALLVIILWSVFF